MDRSVIGSAVTDTCDLVHSHSDLPVVWMTNTIPHGIDFNQTPLAAFGIGQLIILRLNFALDFLSTTNGPKDRF